MIDLGEQPGKVSTDAPSKPSKYYPSMHLDAAHIKALGVKASDIGDETTLMVKVRVSNLSKHKYGEANVGLEMIAACVADDEKKETDFAKALYKE